MSTPSFDPYEYIAIITPGAVVAAGVAFVIWDARRFRRQSAPHQQRWQDKAKPGGMR